MVVNTIVSLGDGQLPAAKGTLYTVPSNTHTLIKVIKLVNTSASLTETIRLYVLPSGAGTSRLIHRFILAPNESAEVTDVYLGTATGLLQGDSTDATTVDYSIHGIESV